MRREVKSLTVAAMKKQGGPGLAVSLTLLIATFAAPQARASFAFGDAGNFAVLYEGTGGKALNFNNGSIFGNIGIGGTGQFDSSGGCSGGNCVITGAIDF